MAGITKRRRPNVTIEDCRIIFRNFEGKEKQFNKAGDRNFAVLLDRDTADAMHADGWNVKQTKPRDEDEDPDPYLPVAIKYIEGRQPPRIVLISSRGRNELDESMIAIVDWVDIAKVDLIVRAYDWEVNGKTGTKAYLSAIYVTIVEDELQIKYADLPDISQNAIEGNNRLQIESGHGSDDIIINEDGSIEGDDSPW